MKIRIGNIVIGLFYEPKQIQRIVHGCHVDLLEYDKTISGKSTNKIKTKTIAVVGNLDGCIEMEHIFFAPARWRFKIWRIYPSRCING